MTDRRKIITGVISVLAVIFLAVAITAGIAIQSNYKNFGTFFQALAVIKKHSYSPLKLDKAVEGVVAGIVDSFNDPFSEYLNPEAYKEMQVEINGNFYGVGILLTKKEGMLTVVEPLKGTPADKAGIKAGDIIVKIDNTRTDKLDREKAVSLIRGPEGTTVKLTIARKGVNKLLEFPLKRQNIIVPSVDGKIIDKTRIAYIRITQFSEKTYEELRETLMDLNPDVYRGIIIDLRDNPGGYLEVVAKVADLFVPKGTIVYVDSRTEKDREYKADEDYIGLPLALLVNEGSASASEILAGAVQDRKSGTVIGTRTFGKAAVQGIYPLTNGGAVKLTTARYLTPKKRDISHKGIDPNIVVEQGEGPQDRQLEKAIQVVNAQLAH